MTEPERAVSTTDAADILNLIPAYGRRDEAQSREEVGMSERVPTPEEVVGIQKRNAAGTKTAIESADARILAESLRSAHLDRDALLSLIGEWAGGAAGGADKHARTLQQFWGGYEVDSIEIDAARAWIRSLVNRLARFKPERETEGE